MDVSRFNINIESDFQDYYDNLASDHNCLGTYRRFYSECEHRSKDMRMLQRIGIKTIELKAVRDYIFTTNRVVVYTGLPNSHESRGKKVLRLDEAKELYGNYLAAPYIEGTEGWFVKVLQIGELRFRLIMRANSEDRMRDFTVHSLEKLDSQYNRNIREPIFSIDYISNSVGDMVAVDFNKVQKLDYLGISEVVSGEQVIEQIKKSLVAFNKLG